jgi:hypothetical protein
MDYGVKACIRPKIILESMSGMERVIFANEALKIFVVCVVSFCLRSSYHVARYIGLRL